MLKTFDEFAHLLRGRLGPQELTSGGQKRAVSVTTTVSGHPRRNISVGASSERPLASAHSPSELAGASHVSTLWAAMHVLRATEPLRLWLSCALMALSLLVLPTGSGRGMLLLLLDGPCGADCPCDGEDEGAHDDCEETAAPGDGALADYAPAVHGDGDTCPPDCSDCHCCAASAVAVLEHVQPSAMLLDAFGFDVRGPPGTVASGADSGVYRPPRG